jgi:hypothetical protein
MNRLYDNGHRKFSPGGLKKKAPPIFRGLLGISLILLLISSGGSAAGQGNKTYALDMTKCGGFTVEDAAKLLGLPVSKLSAKTEKMAPELWRCSFISQDGKGLSFSISIAKDAKKAAAELERLRNNLEVAAETAPFKNKLPKGAYSEISGLGEESVWTDVNGTLTVRKGNITLQVLMPAGKLEQIKVAQALLSKF